MIENELDRAEKRIDEFSLENARLKDEVRTLSNELKSFEASDEQFAEREGQVNTPNRIFFNSIYFSNFKHVIN